MAVAASTHFSAWTRRGTAAQQPRLLLEEVFAPAHLFKVCSISAEARGRWSRDYGKHNVELGDAAKCVSFTTSDLESLSGNYDTVCCIDVMIHYPTAKMGEMVQKLCSMSNERVIVSFAPDTWYYTLLKKVGELFPGPSKTTRAYLHTEEAVRKALGEVGFTVKRTEMTATNFYFSRMLEAIKE